MNKFIVLIIILSTLTITYVSGDYSNLKIKLTIASCPSPFSGKGNVVELRFNNNDAQVNFKVKEKFNFPDKIDDACPVMETSIMANQENKTVLSFTTEWGLLSVIDINTGNLTSFAKGSSADQYLFDGFTSMKIATNFQDILGLTPHVTQDGFCSDGCFRFGMQNIQTGVFSALEGNGPGGALPFKASSSQTSYHDESNDIFYIQGSYPLNSMASCNSDETTDCLLAIDTKLGKLISSKLLPENIVVYKYHSNNSSASNVLAFVFGFEKICNHPYQSYAFVHLDLTNSKIIGKPVCMAKSITVHQKPEMGAFSNDGKYFALANGDTEGSAFQFLLFDTETGDAVVNSELIGLKKALHVSNEVPLMQVWGISS